VRYIKICVIQNATVYQQIVFQMLILAAL